ncbi:MULTISPECIES: DUF4494 domain-containing protein [Mediterranea]|uniref:DUF4494 domain-containing protein n=1 Tax=Mediterranea TaxID=1926659 RepID=UPI002013B806|nr:MULTISPECIES: DUF4494 domain-containing protein [Mediterranea]MCL1606666.1 DUF4494 domain-containing protein [Mediterranea sp. ET5]MDM8122712.1 DUF4494 domain-containing protein [Mediterranea massiliensis]MDM8197168.1 DUF4494 domain-containing protein [Mediterranea massiliensis]
MKLFECGIRYEKTLENGMQKKVTELYIVDAISFTEAESRIIGEMSAFISGEFAVVSEKITNYSELVETVGGDKWYKAKVNFMTLDEKTGKEKKQAFYYLIQANDIDHARSRLTEFMHGSLADWECEALQETKIMDVFLYAPDALMGKAQTYEGKVLQEASEAVAASPSCQRAAKRFIDSIPDGQKVTISVPGCKDVVIDKTHGHETQDDA